MTNTNSKLAARPHSMRDDSCERFRAAKENKAMLTADNITDKQIRDLLRLAKAEGRKATVYLCKIALDEGATHQTAAKIRDARS